MLEDRKVLGDQYKEQDMRGDDPDRHQDVSIN